MIFIIDDLASENVFIAEPDTFLRIVTRFPAAGKGRRKMRKMKKALASFRKE